MAATLDSTNRPSPRLSFRFASLHYLLQRQGQRSAFVLRLVPLEAFLQSALAALALLVQAHSLESADSGQPPTTAGPQKPASGIGGHRYS